MKIKLGLKNIVWMSDNFKEWFGNLDCKGKKVPLYFKTLEKYMKEEEILVELKPTPCTLPDLYNMLDDNRMLKNDFVNIFYIKDNHETLRSVSAHWFGAGWYLRAHAVDSPRGWDDGPQVVSRTNMNNFDSFDPSIESRLLDLKSKMSQLEKIINLD